ncbi:MAG: hypothetical protein R3Y63_10510 [Eubacteriales bacterium]
MPYKTMELPSNQENVFFENPSHFLLLYAEISPPNEKSDCFLEINQLLKDKKLFYDWSFSDSRLLSQFREIESILKKEGEFSKKEIFSLFLNLRHMIELHIVAEEKEDILYKIYNQINHIPLFQLPSPLLFSEYEEIIQEYTPILCEKPSTILIWNIENFSSLALRFLDDLEKAGFEIVLITNQKNFSFLSWETDQGNENNNNTENIRKDSMNQSTNLAEIKKFESYDKNLFLCSLHALWNKEKEELNWNRYHLKNALHSGIFPISFLRTFYKIESFLKNISNHSEFKEFMTILIERKKSSLPTDIPFHLLSIYDENYLSWQELEEFSKCIEELNTLSFLLFHDATEDFTEIFSDLSLFYNNSQAYFFKFQEEKIQSFYHSRFQSLENNPLWKKFQVFESVEVEQKKAEDFSHFLTDSYRFSQESLKEIVKTISIPHSFKDDCNSPEISPSQFSLIHPKQKTPLIHYDRYHTISSFLCPNRYIFSYIFNETPLFLQENMYEKFYENLLVLYVWQNEEDYLPQKIIENLPQLIRDADHKFSHFFPFFTEKQRLECRILAGNYLRNSIITRNNTLRDFAPSHMEMKWLFGEAAFEQKQKFLAENFNLPIFSTFHGKENKYSLHNIPKKEGKTLAIQEALTDFINSNENRPNKGPWCEFCPHEVFCP